MFNDTILYFFMLCEINYLSLSLSSSIKVILRYRTCFYGIWNTVILVVDVFISNLFCVSQVTMRESSVLMLCVNSSYVRVACIMISIVSNV